MRAFFISCLLLFSGLSYSQTWDWAKSLWGRTPNHVMGVEADNKGNIYVTGRFRDTMHLTANDSLVAPTTSTGYFDAFVAKYNDQGTLIWARRFGGNRDDAGYNITCDTAGYVYLACYTRSTTAITYDNFSYTGTGNDKTFILKIAPNGNLVWGRAVTAGTSNAYPVGIAVSRNGHLVVSGSYSFLDMTVDSTVLKYVGSEEVFITMFSSTNGALKWAKAGNGRYLQYGYNVAVDDTGNVYTTGLYNGTIVFSTTDSLINGVNGGNYRTFLSKHDSLGNVKWLSAYYGQGDHIGDGIVITKNSEIYITGWHGSGTHTLNDSVFSTSGSRLYLQKVSSSGASQWTRHYPTSYLGRIDGMACDSNSNVYLAGFISGLMMFDTFQVQGSSSGYANFIVKVGANGQTHMAATGGSKVMDNGIDYLSVDNSGSAYIVGYFGPAVNDSSTYGTHVLVSRGNYDGHIVKFDPSVLCGAEAGFTSADTVCSGGTVTFTNTSTGAIFYQWKLNDSLFSQAQHPSFIFSGSGSYTVKLLASTGQCSDSVTAIIQVDPVYTLPFNYVLCQGDSLLLGNTYRNSAGTYYDSLTTPRGCDSVRVYVLTVNPEYTFNVNRQICSGDSVFLGGKYRNSNGTYYDSLHTFQGCDSIYITALSVVNSFIQNSSLEICSGDSVFLGGQYRSVAGTYTDSLISVSGCDSLIHTSLLVNQPQQVISMATICQGDSLLVFGSWLKQAGVYVGNLKTVKGCDSTVFFRLDVDPSYYLQSQEEICAGDSVVIFGTYRKTAALYSDSLKTSYGCDSILVVDLIVNPLPSVSFTGLDTFYCTHQAAVTLTGLPTGGVFSGPGLSGNTFTPPAAGIGIHTLIYSFTDANSCQNEDSQITRVDACVGITEINRLQFTLFPNPNGGIFILESSEKELEITVTDLNGKAVFVGNLHGTESIRESLDLSYLAPGIYQIKAVSGEKISIEKLSIY